MAGKREPVGARAWLRAAATPAMLGALLGLLAIAVVCGLLGRWQLDRAQQRAEVAAQAQLAKENNAGPIALSSVQPPQSALRADAVGRRVLAEGTYDQSGQLLVPGRVLGGRDGYLVLAPLRTSLGAVLPVVRGWVAKPDDASRPPAGNQQVAGVFAASEAATGDDAPAGQIHEVSSAELVGIWGGPIYPGYLIAERPDPAAPAMAVLPPPAASAPGWNLQSLFYALEWWIFGAFALILWWRIVRDRARGARKRAPALAGHGGRPAAD